MYSCFICPVLNKCCLLAVYVAVVTPVVLLSGKNMIDSNITAIFHSILLLYKKSILGILIVALGKVTTVCNRVR